MKPDPSLGCFIILLSLLGGVLLAGPLADTSGLITDDRYSDFIPLWRICCGVLAALLLLYGLRTLLYLSLEAIGTLQGLTTKPNWIFAMTLIVGGSLCLLATLGLECVFISRFEALNLSSVLHLQGGGTNVVVDAGMGRPTLMLLILQAFAGLVFLAGSIMIGIGIWSSIPPQTGNSSN